MPLSWPTRQPEIGRATRKTFPRERFPPVISVLATRIVSADLYVLPCQEWFSGKDSTIMNHHEGPGVVPGRYAGEAIAIHDGPTPDQLAFAEQRAHADALAGRICAAAAEASRSQYVLVELVGEFDAIGAIRYWTDFKSLAHWLSWCCSMTPGVAREHVRVAKALRKMATIKDLFREGRLSYSKVREVTRVVDVVAEQRLAALALTATASQLARMIRGFRSADARRINQQTKRTVSWHEARRRHDRLPCPAAEGRGRPADRGAGGGAGPVRATAGETGSVRRAARTLHARREHLCNAAALLDVARGFLNTAPQDRSGEDRAMVVVHVSAENLAGGVPAGTSASRGDLPHRRCRLARGGYRAEAGL
jgi:hypothetical protein